MPNLSGVNSGAINASERSSFAVNDNTANATPVNGGVTPQLSGETIVSFEQSVGRSYSGSLLSIEQAIQFVNSFSGALVQIEQSLANQASGTLLQIEQRVKDATVLTNVDKFGFDARVYVDGVEIAQNKIHGIINVTRGENSAALAEFTILPDSGALELDWWRGKSVLIDVEKADGIRRIYTGTIDIPEVDLINKRLTLRCTDRRNQQINEQFNDADLGWIGYWSSSIFEEADDQAENLEYRLRTVPKTVDFDAFGNYHVSSYFPKTAPDFTLSDAGIYRRQPRISLASRGRLVNKINLDFKFRYVRLRQRERDFYLSGPTLCEALGINGVSFLKRTEIQSNIEGFGWAVKPNSIEFDDAPAPGKYACPTGEIYWNPIEVSGDTRQKVDENCDPILDSSGNPIYELINKVYTNHATAFALGASWVASKRFAQDIEMTTSYVITAPQSITQYGEIERTMRHGHEYEYDPADFEREDIYREATGFAAPAGGGDFFVDKTGDPRELKLAAECAANMAITMITKSHRDNYLEFETPLWPEIDMRHTVETTAGRITCRGKVSTIRHTIDVNKRFAETHVKIGFSQSVGAATETPIIVRNDTPDVVGGLPKETFTMNVFKSDTEGSIFGGDYSNPAEQEEGITTPDIDDESRNRQLITYDETITVEITDDPFTVTL